MMKNLSIVHIEDEYKEFLSLATTLKTMIEDYWEMEKGVETIARTTKLAESEDKPQKWIVYEIVADANLEQIFRYIFVRDEEMPDCLIEYLQDVNIFVIDILRPNENGTALSISVERSIASVQRHVQLTEDIVLFSAYQGSSLGDRLSKSPRKIDKVSDGELESFFGSVLVRCMADD